MNIRTFFIISVITGVFILRASWMPADWSAFLLVFIPILAALNVLYEIGFLIQLLTACERVKAEVVESPAEDSKFPARRYKMTFSFRGSSYSRYCSEPGYSNSLDGATYCYVRVQIEPPHAVFIDNFKLRYMYLGYALLIAAMVYSYGNYKL